MPDPNIPLVDPADAIAISHGAHADPFASFSASSRHWRT